MSSIDSASMPGSEVGEKSAVDYGTKGVCLKAQAEGSIKCLSSVGPTRNTPGNMRPAPVTSGHPGMPVLSSVASHKPGLGRVATSSMQGGPGQMGRSTLTTTVLPVTSHVATYHVPRGAAVVANMASRATTSPLCRPAVNVQPVGTQASLKTTTNPPNTMTRAPSPSWGAQQANNVISVPRCISPSTMAPRTTGHGFLAARPTTTPVTSTVPAKTIPPRVTEAPRPLLIHAAPQKPITITQGTQLQLGSDKTIKVATGTVAQVVPIRPPFSTSSGIQFAPSPATGNILQGGAVSSSTVLTTPVRLAVAAAQPPLLATQRVSVASTGTVLASRIAVSTVGPASAQTVALTPGQARLAAGVNQGTILAAPNRIGGCAVIPGQGQSRLSVQSTTAILSTPATRLAPYTGTQMMSTQPAMLATPARMGHPGTTTTTTATGRAPVTINSHQAVTTRTTVAGTTTTTTAQRFATSAALTRTSTTAVTCVTTCANPPLVATSPRLPSTPSIVVHPQLVVAGVSGKSGIRPMQIHTTTPGQKVIAQPLHGPIQLTQTAVTSKTLNQSVTQASITKQMCYSASTRPLAQTIPIAKMFPQGSGSLEQASELPVVSQGQPSGVLIQTSHRALSSPGLLCQTTERGTNPPTLSTYTLPSGASYFYEAPSGYQLATDAPLVARPLSPDAPLVSRQLSSEGPLIARPFTPGGSTFAATTTIRSTAIPSHGLMSTSQGMRFNPVMLVDNANPGPFNADNSTLLISDSSMMHQGQAANKLTSSPRPSILRKRDVEPSPSKVVKNLTPMLSSASASRSASPSPPSLHLETNQQSTDHGPSSNGSTTISATSSPGPDDPGDSSLQGPTKELLDDLDRPPVEMSPRKKPRKQLLNDANDAIDMEFISEERLKKVKVEEGEDEEMAGAGAGASKMHVADMVAMKRRHCSLLHSYQHNWKPRYNHFMRYTDVKPKEERRPTVTDLANQKTINDRINGWKVHQLRAQIETLTEMDSDVLDRLSVMLRNMDKNASKELDRDVSRVNELVMGNVQRSKVMRDQLTDVQTQMLKVLDHKVHVSAILARCATKKNFKKREKY